VPFRLYDSGEEERKRKPASFSIVMGTVTNNCDLIMQGKVLVRVTAVDAELWARLSAVGGGAKSGIFWVPKKGEAVLVALNQSDYSDAFVLGGLYSSADPPPVDDPLEAPVKRVIRTGQTEADGHTIELDDAAQSISIVTTTRQKVLIDPKKIELSNAAGNLTITLDNGAQKVTVKGVNVEIRGTASLKLDAPKIDVSSTGPIGIASKTVCSISGTTRVDIN
jgi:phage baseplate assembly protein V